MSNKVANYEELDEMPTEYLRSLLSLDINGASGVKLDADAIMHILEVIQSRDEADGVDVTVDTAAAWKDFNENYRPAPEDADREEETADVPKCMQAASKKHLHLKRFLITAAVIVAVLAAGTAAASAGGVDLWGVVVKWAAQTFGLENDMEYADKGSDKVVLPCKDLQELLDVDGVPDKLVPTWLPKGFTQQGCGKSGTPQMNIYHANYANGSKEITIQIFWYLNGMGAVETYEKLPTTYNTYSVGGVDHYISQNSDGSLAALWNTESCECSIIATVTEAEMEQIITSIYGG
jgi:hypothetical protein